MDEFKKLIWIILRPNLSVYFAFCVSNILIERKLSNLMESCELPIIITFKSSLILAFHMVLLSCRFVNNVRVGNCTYFIKHIVGCDTY